MTARERLLVVLWLLCSMLGLNGGMMGDTIGAAAAGRIAGYTKTCKQDSDCRVGYYCEFQTKRCVPNRNN